jgi:hypothetical protein
MALSGKGAFPILRNANVDPNQKPFPFSEASVPQLTALINIIIGYSQNEAIVIPENIDAIRALMGTVKEGHESIRITDEALGMRRGFLTAEGHLHEVGA